MSRPPPSQQETTSTQQQKDETESSLSNKKKHHEIEYELPALLPPAKREKESKEFVLPALLPAAKHDKDRRHEDNAETSLRIMETFLDSSSSPSLLQDSSSPSLVEATDFTETTLAEEPIIVREEEFTTTTITKTTKSKRRTVRFDDGKTVVHEFAKVTPAERYLVWYNKHEEAQMMQLNGNARNSMEMAIDAMGFAGVRSSLQSKFGNVARPPLTPEQRRRQQVLRQPSNPAANAGLLTRAALRVFLLAFLVVMIAFVVLTTPPAKSQEQPPLPGEL